MAVMRGAKTTFGFGEESVHGTPVAATDWSEIISESVMLTREPVVKESMRRISESETYQPVKRVGGDVNLEGMYDGQLKLWKHALGTVVDSGAGPDFLHTFTLADDVPTPGMTFAIGREIQNFRYPGGKINTVNITIEAGGLLKVTLGITAQDEIKFTVGAATFPTERIIPFNQGIFYVGGVATTIKSFSLDINNNLDMERDVLSSETVEEQVRTGLREITGSFTRVFQTADVAALYDLYAAMTDEALRLEFIGATLGGTNYQWFLDLFRIKFGGATPVAEGPGIIEVEYPFRALFDETGAQDALRLRITNGEATT